MVSLANARAAIATFKTSVPPPTVLFVGATSGIGRATLLQLAEHTPQPNIYVVGRSKAAAAPLLEQLQALNATGVYHLIETDVSRLGNVERVCAEVAAKETKLDLLYLSAGFISFEGRQPTEDGLDASMALRYYGRALLMQRLLPLLSAAPSPRVVNILAGGQEGPIDTDDLSLARPANYSFAKAAVHSATMLTLFMERLAAEHPRISFVHVFPGPTYTPTFTRGSSGVKYLFMRWVVSPLMWVFAKSAVDAGERALYIALVTNYVGTQEAGDGPMRLLNIDGEDAGNEKVLKELREKGTGGLVWKHTEDVFQKLRSEMM